MTQSKLTFNEVLISSATNPISSKDLLTRLEKLYNELSEMEQDDVDTSSLNRVKDDLINRKLLRHTNKGVQAYVSCCIADILRLYAPDAPYDESTLQAIFRLITLQFEYLDDSDSPYYQQYVYLLKRVAEVKLIALMTDLENSGKMILNLFERFYALSALKGFDSENLQPFLIDILSEVINEVDQLDMKVLKLILNKFLANSKNLKNQSTIKVPGFDISLALCELNVDKLSRLITFFFSEMILEATTNKNDSSPTLYSESDDSDDEISSIDVVQLKKIHTLAVELWRYVPEILTAVLGLFDTELEAEDEIIKTVVTNTISKILAIPTSRVNFPNTFVSTYTNWLKKSLDINVVVRITWVKGIANILEARHDIVADIAKGLMKTLIDTNEKVRFATIVELSKMKPCTFLERLASQTLIETLLKLLREKHSLIRNEVIQFLSAIYDFSVENELYRDSNLTKKIANHILNLIYINDNRINEEVNMALFEKILPFDSSSQNRVSRYLFLISILEEKPKTALYALLKRQTQFSKVILHLLSILEDEMNFEKEEMIGRAVSWISKSFTDPLVAETCLHGFLNMRNRRLNRLLHFCATETTDYDTLVSSMKEILNKVNDPKIVQNIDLKTLGSNSLYETMKLLLLICSNICFNVDNVKELIKLNAEGGNPQIEYVKETLDQISQQVPNVMSSCVKDLCEKINSQSIHLDTRLLNDTTDLGHDLRIVFNTLISQGSNIKPNSGFFNNLYAYATEGSVLEAKFAIKLINEAPPETKNILFVKIVNSIYPLELESTYFNTHLSALSTLFICDLFAVDHITEDLSRFLAGEVLLKNNFENGTQLDEDDSSWITDKDLYYEKSNKLCLSKILTMKLLSNWLLSLEKENTQEVDEVSKPILSMLSSFINRGGEIVSTGDTPSRYCSRLRLHAGIQILKISRFSIYDKLIDQRRINRLVLLVQDVEFEVRKKFVNKLKKLLTLKSISKKYLALIFMTAFEPSSELKSQTSIWIRSLFNQQKTTSFQADDHLLFEKSFPRLIYMIINHPEFKELYISFKASDEQSVSDKLKELATFAITYISYYLSLIANADNISLLFYFCQRMNQYKPIPLFEHDVADKSSLYFVSEISQATIKYVAKNHGWSVSLWPNKLNLPHDLYERLDKEDSVDSNETGFVSEKNQDAILEIVRNKWRAERSFISTKKSKKRNDNDNINEYAKDFDHQEQEKLKAAKQRKRKANSRTEEDENYDGRALIEVDPQTVTTRRSKRGKRINYTED
ncbi:hypothetical protein CANINC_004353 [Pichia inconspicua]|uniref:Sister chromatid cohesion protein n=1 Tax=Pichia inconspicua TaxID=52247 RepID=A0A4T0WWH9_9ASCO|nr:hypothetical protein CANINC_004353 [[Candida] inconspicua]